MGEYRVLGTLLLLTAPEHTERVLGQLPAGINHTEGWAAGSTRLPNNAGLSFKVLAHESEPVRALVRACWSTARQAVTGHPAPTPFAWR
jgi:urease accessory protein